MNDKKKVKLPELKVKSKVVNKGKKDNKKKKGGLAWTWV